MTLKQYHQVLIKIAMKDLKEARKNEREILTTSHLDREVDEAKQAVLDAEAVVYFLTINRPLASEII
jgi:hypothetical protein